MRLRVFAEHNCSFSETARQGSDDSYFTTTLVLCLFVFRRREHLSARLHSLCNETEVTHRYGAGLEDEVTCRHGAEVQ